MGSGRTADWARGASLLALALLLTLSGACLPGQAGDGRDRQAGELQQRVTAQETRIAALQAQNNALQTAVAKFGLPPTPTPVVMVASLPTQAPVAVPAPVLGLPVSGASKGVAGAKVTLTAFMDYL